MSMIRITYGSDVIRLRCDLAEASAHLVVDGETTAWQTADARHNTDHAVLLAAMVAWPEVCWPTRPRYGSDRVQANDAWDRLVYETLDEKHNRLQESSRCK